jgi:hypothetical protein
MAEIADHDHPFTTTEFAYPAPVGSSQGRPFPIVNTVASSKRSALTSVQVDGETMMFRVTQDNDQGIKVEQIDFSGSDMAPSDIGGGELGIAVDSDGILQVAQTKPVDLIKRSGTFAYTYASGCPSWYNGQGTVGATVELGKEPEELTERVLGAALCFVLTNVANLLPQGFVATVACSAVAGEIIQRSLSGSFTYGYADKDNQWGWVAEPYTQLGFANEYEADPTNWIFLGGHTPPQVFHGAHVNAAI